MPASAVSLPDDLWSIAPMGDHGLLITWRGPKPAAQQALRAVEAALAARPVAGVVETVRGIETVLICYDPRRCTRSELAARLPPTLTPVPDDRSHGLTHRIAVVYGGPEGPDLGWVAANAGLSDAEVIALHTARPMPVLMVGFMPGFPYIGGLPPRLRLPRRSEPRAVVSAGSVAIANDQTGIYPAQSPGGWHIIGRTSTPLWDATRQPPALLRAGDFVQFLAEGAES